MNLANWSPRKKLLAMGALLFAIVGIVLTIFLVQRQHDLRSRAERSTTISLSAHEADLAPGDEAKFDVTVNPGTNQVNFVKLTINYDPQVFSGDENSFELDSSSPLQVVSDPSVSDGSLTVSLGVGSDPTRVIQSIQKIGSLKLTVVEDAPSGPSEVRFDDENTQARSIAGGDAFNENVLASTQPATVEIGGGVCVPNVGKCSWSPVSGADSYHYKTRIAPEAGEESVLDEGNTSETSVEFDTVPGNAYRCEVFAVNGCGEGPEGESESECPIPTATPTPTPTSTPTPTPTASPTPSPSPSPSPSPTASPTPAPTLVITQPPQIVITDTPEQPVGGPEEVPIEEVASPSPTLPPTGVNTGVIGGILGGVLLIIGGLALLFL
jgi:hypothetical protein